MTRHLRVTRHRLDDAVRDLLGKEITERVTETELDSDADEAILARIGAHALQRYLPGEVLDTLRLYPVTDQHVLFLENLPQQNFPPTPVTGFGAEATLAATNAIHFGLIQILGLAPFAVAYENDGRLIRNVVPNPDATGATSSWGADTEFFWHTDNPHLPFGDPGNDPRLYIPRYLTFYTVRNDEQVLTDLAALEDVTVRLSPDTLHELHAPQFRVGAPASSAPGEDGTRTQRPATAVLERGAHGQVWARYDRGTTVGQAAPAVAALREMSDVMAQLPPQGMVLQPGHFLIFDNYRVLHRRGAFTPAPSPTARWLRRCYAS